MSLTSLTYHFLDTLSPPWSQTLNILIWIKNPSSRKLVCQQRATLAPCFYLLNLLLIVSLHSNSLVTCLNQALFKTKFEFWQIFSGRILNLASMSNVNNNSNKRRRRNLGANSTKICLRFVDENSGTVPRRSQLQTLKSPLMPTLAESGMKKTV